MMKHTDGHRKNKQEVLTSPNKLVAKEASAVNSSCRVYYGGAAVAVPFMWESQPGTPKHTLSDTSLPPLTPPPSYSVPTPKHYLSLSMQRSGSRAKALLESIFSGALRSSRKGARNMSPSSSVSWSSSSSSSWSSTSSKGAQKRYSVSRVPFGYEDADEDLRRSGSPIVRVMYGCSWCS